MIVKLTGYTAKAKLLLVLMAFILLFASAGIAAADKAEAAAEDEETISDEDQLWLERYWEIYQYVKKYHVSGPSAEQLSEWAIYGLLQSLDDPYTYYMNDEENQELIESINGSSFGVGIVLVHREEGFLIEELIPGSPAASSGLQIGDRLTKVNQEELTASMTLQQVVGLISGDEQTAVKLTAERWSNQQKASKTYTIKRASLKLPMTEAYMLDKTVGYLRLRSVGSDAPGEMEQSLKELRSSGMKELIVDLRGNSGGFLDAAAQVAKLFKPSGVLLHMKDSTGSLQSYTFEDGMSFTEPLVVLVDGGTASAAEVLAGFLQDSEIGHILGETTFGKGTIQELIELESGGVLRLTVQEYFTPNKHAVHHQGIQPDTIVMDRAFQVAQAYSFLTGKKELRIDKQGEVILNGLAASDGSVLPNETYRHNGKLYLSIRTLMNWFDGKVEWEAASQAVVASLEGKKATLKRSHSALKLVQSKSFIDVEQIAGLLPLKVTREGETYLIQKAPAAK